VSLENLMNHGPTAGGNRMTALTVGVLAALASVAFQQDVTPAEYNGDQLAMQAAQGFIVPGRFSSDPVRVDPDGGFVIGKHGGAEHVMVDFPDSSVFDRLTLDDKMHIYAHGVGMELTNFNGVQLFSMSPTLMDALTQAGMGITGSGLLRVPVAKIVPARVMGSGLGASQVYRGDYDIQMFDEAVVEEYGLDELRFGDIVAIVNSHHDQGRIFKEGSIAIGVIAHSNSFIAGRGPGFPSLMSSKDGKIEPMVTDRANLAHLLEIR